MYGLNAPLNNKSHERFLCIQKLLHSIHNNNNNNNNNNYNNNNDTWIVQITIIKLKILYSKILTKFQLEWYS